jgi:hypothetical protein
MDDAKKNILLATIVLGSICGLIEVATKNILNYNGIHLSGLIIGLDFIVIGIALAILRSPLMIIGMGLIACLCKQLVVPLLGLSFMCKANSCLAIMLEFATFASLAAFTLNKMKTSATARALTAGAGIFVSSILFYTIGMCVVPCPYLLSFNIPGGFISFILKEGVVWSIFAAMLFPMGWKIGESLSAKVFELSLQRPRLYYAGATLVTIFCLLGCALAIYSGV